tara:strand:+ start:104 stop:238 length:135 start_codon:yes stop_codon:yes gene_type:complete
MEIDTSKMYLSYRGIASAYGENKSAVLIGISPILKKITPIFKPI